MLERTILLLLDGKGCLIREKLLSIGTIDAALVSPREIFLQALRVGAVSFLLLHNHPSGDPAPSREDCLFPAGTLLRAPRTKNLQSALPCLAG